MAGESVVGYSPVSISKKSNGGRTKPKLANIAIGRLKDALVFPDVDDKGVKIVGDITMKTPANMINLEVTASTIAITQASEGDPDNKGVKQKMEFSRPGSDDIAFEEFAENNVNEDLFAIISYQGSKVKKVLGYPGNPLQLAIESTDNNEGDSNKVTLESVLRGRRIAFYEGKMPAIEGVTPAGSASGQSV